MLADFYMINTLKIIIYKCNCRLDKRVLITIYTYDLKLIDRSTIRFKLQNVFQV